MVDKNRINDDEIILETDDRAAEYKTVKGWVSYDSYFFGEDEDMARRKGATHKKCQCGHIYEKHGYCVNCHRKDREEKYEKMPFKLWDGQTPLCLFDDDMFFYILEDIESYLDDLDDDSVKAVDLKFVICEPQYPHLIDNDYFADILPEDLELEDCASRDLLDAIHKFNEFAEKTPFSWGPGKYRTSVEVI